MDRSLPNFGPLMFSKHFAQICNHLIHQKLQELRTKNHPSSSSAENHGVNETIDIHDYGYPDSSYSTNRLRRTASKSAVLKIRRNLSIENKSKVIKKNKRSKSFQMPLGECTNTRDNTVEKSIAVLDEMNLVKMRTKQFENMNKDQMETVPNKKTEVKNCIPSTSSDNVNNNVLSGVLIENNHLCESTTTTTTRTTRTKTRNLNKQLLSGTAIDNSVSVEEKKPKPKGTRTKKRQDLKSKLILEFEEKEKENEALAQKAREEALAQKAREEALAQKAREEALAQKAREEALAQKAREEALAQKAREEALAQRAREEALAQKAREEALAQRAREEEQKAKEERAREEALAKKAKEQKLAAQEKKEALARKAREEKEAHEKRRRMMEEAEKKREEELHLNNKKLAEEKKRLAMEEKMKKKKEALKKKHEALNENRALAAKKREEIMLASASKKKEAADAKSKLQSKVAEAKENLRPEQNEKHPVKKPLHPAVDNLKKLASPSYSMTPPRDERQPAKPKTANNYGIDDASASDSTDDEQNPKKRVPEWARSSHLSKMVSIQSQLPLRFVQWMMDCDTDPFKTLGYLNRIQRPRTSSAVWDTPILSKSMMEKLN